MSQSSPLDAADQAGGEGQRRLHVVFRVGDAEYVIPGDEVLQMETFTGATPVPDAAAHVAGLMQIRGRVIPILDLRIRFGLPAAHDGALERRVVVVQRGRRAIGLLVDSAREVVYLDASAMQPLGAALGAAGRGCVRGVLPVGSRLLMVIDLDPIVGQESAHGE